MNQSLSIPSIEVPAEVSVRRWWRIYQELGKFRLSLLVVMTAALGFVMAPAPTLDWATFGWAMLGTGLCAWAANAANQAIEVHRDARMKRTMNRPLPSARMGSHHAWIAVVMATGLGLTILLAWTNVLTAGLAALTIILYVGCYTPMKVHSSLNTLVGAVVGAIPPLMGWTAAVNELSAGAWILAALLLVWQVPHFLALAWLYREDYERGGFRMLPSLDPHGTFTVKAVVLWTFALIPVSLAALWVGIAGPVYAVGAVAAGLWLLRGAWAMHRELSRDTARRLFLATVLYLPILMLMMVLDRQTPYRPVAAGPKAVLLSPDLP